MTIVQGSGDAGGNGQVPQIEGNQILDDVLAIDDSELTTSNQAAGTATETLTPADLESLTDDEVLAILAEEIDEADTEAALVQVESEVPVISEETIAAFDEFKAELDKLELGGELALEEFADGVTYEDFGAGVMTEECFNQVLDRSDNSGDLTLNEVQEAVAMLNSVADSGLMGTDTSAASVFNNYKHVVNFFTVDLTEFENNQELLSSYIDRLNVLGINTVWELLSRMVEDSRYDVQKTESEEIDFNKVRALVEEHLPLELGNGAVGLANKLRGNPEGLDENVFVKRIHIMQASGLTSDEQEVVEFIASDFEKYAGINYKLTVDELQQAINTLQSSPLF